MYNIIPLVLILASLTIIIFILARKFSVLASIDIESIPKEKEAKIKEEIVSNRLKRNLVKWSAKLVKTLKFIGAKILLFSKWIYSKLHEMRDNYKQKSKISPEEKEFTLSSALEEARELQKAENYQEAEKKLIEIISFDSQNIEVFRLLGEVYFEQKNYNDSREAFKHVVKLLENEEEEESLAEIYFDLALIDQAEENWEAATEMMKKTLKLNPNNPRYLDTMLEISIINKDKISALDAFEKLEKINPENKKLTEFKERITNL